jgi:hypothetical protein
VSQPSFSGEQGVIMTQNRASAHPQLHHGRFDRALPAWEKFTRPESFVACRRGWQSFSSRPWDESRTGPA